MRSGSATRPFYHGSRPVDTPPRACETSSPRRRRCAMGRFDGQVVVVTGAAAGIGAAAARRFVAEGARVVLGDIDAAGASALARELDQGSGVALAHAVDVSDAAAVEALVAAAVAHFGRLDRKSVV